MKKLFMICSILLVILILYSCDDSINENDELQVGGREITVFKMLIAHDNPNNDQFNSPVALEIERKTDVRLDIETIDSAEAATRIKEMIASKSYPDFVYAKGDLKALKEIDMLVKLDDYIEKYGANIKEFYGDELKRLKWSGLDPGIYYIGGDNKIGQEEMEPRNGFQLQHAVVKELGYPKMETLSDFENAIKEYKRKYPTIDGKETIGMSLIADNWRALISMTNPACFATGGPDDGEWYVDQETMKIQRHLTRPEEKEYFRWLNHMYNIGLLDSESFTQDYDKYKTKIASGRVLGLSDARWQISEPITALKGANKEDRCYGYYPLTLEEGVKHGEFMDSGYPGGWGIGITKSCKDVEKAVQFFDWMCSEEAQILLQWGIEGVHYDIVNGKRVWKQEIKEMHQKDPKFSKKTGIGNYVYPFPSYGNAVKDSTGQYFTPTLTLENIKLDQTDIENEVLANYGAKVWKDLYPTKNDFPSRPYGVMYSLNIDNERISAIDEAIKEIGYIMIPEAIKAKPSEFDKKYNNYLEAIKDAGLDEVTKEYEKAMNDRIELWK